MAKATVTLPGGAVVTVEGTSDEVSTLVRQLSGAIPKERPAVTRAPRANRRSPRGPVGYIRSLKEEGFFKTKRTIGDIQKKLEEQGHIYQQESLSPALVKSVRSRTLRRLKEGGVWKYVNP